MTEQSGLDQAFCLEAIYYSAQIPRNLAILNVLGAVFDRVYFPGVYLPKSGFDRIELDKEIRRLTDLGPQYQDFETRLLIGALNLTRYAGVLEGFCEFTAKRPQLPSANEAGDASSFRSAACRAGATAP